MTEPSLPAASIPTPVVSIITTYRNPGPYLDEALDSLRQQTCRDWICYLCDDGSTDDGPQRAQRASDADDRFVLMSTGGAGRQAALAQCHARVESEYVAWLDADDRLHPEALTHCRRLLDSRPELGMVYTEHTRIDSLGQTFERPATAPI